MPCRGENCPKNEEEINKKEKEEKSKARFAQEMYMSLATFQLKAQGSLSLKT